jgi:hypothetical protein
MKRARASMVGASSKSCRNVTRTLNSPLMRSVACVRKSESKPISRNATSRRIVPAGMPLSVWKSAVRRRAISSTRGGGTGEDTDAGGGVGITGTS